jgi:C4-type Zn-finger protein
MKALDFTFLTNKSFEKKFNDEREPKSLVIPILDMKDEDSHVLRCAIGATVVPEILFSDT